MIEGHRAVKIGVARNPAERLATLQTGSPHPLTLAYSMPITGDAYAVEAEAHATLHRHRVSGEWFSVAPSMAVAAINEAAYRLGSASPDNAGLRQSSWTGRVTRIAALFTPAWIALSSQRPLVFASCAFAAQFVVAAWLVRARPAKQRSFFFVKWAGALVTGLALSMLAGLLVGRAIATSAQERPLFPAYDPAEYCKRLSALVGDNALIRDGCISTQNDAKDQLRKVWSDAPVKMEADCIHLMEAAGQMNYQAVAGCVAMNVGSAWLKGDLQISPSH